MSMLPELLAPAGTMEKLRTAVRFGADAVYMGGPSFGLRAGAGNFSLDEMHHAVEYCHRHGVRAYLTLNSFVSNNDIDALESLAKKCSAFPFDAWIVSDPAAIEIARSVAPSVPLHLSTQANTTNWKSASFWKSAGIRRVNLARETSLEEMKETVAKSGVECEVFVHGAMCISYSGRCLLSHTLNSRSANRGECTHPCRWKYRLVEETRPGEYFPVEEHQDGTFIFNSRDLCLVRQIPELVSSGVSALKIEGRMKSMYYVAAVTRVYRQALDDFRDDPDGWTPRREWADELSRLSHRGYTTGFLFGTPENDAQEYHSDYIRTHRFVGVVESVLDDGRIVIGVRNRIMANEQFETIAPHMKSHSFTITRMERLDPETGEYLPVSEAHPNQKIAIRTGFPLEPGDLLRQENPANTAGQV